MSDSLVVCSCSNLADANDGELKGISRALMIINYVGIYERKLIAGAGRPSQQGMIMVCRRSDANRVSTRQGKPLSLPCKKVRSSAP